MMNKDLETMIISVETKEDGTLWVERRIKSNMMYARNPPRPVPDRVFREVYGAKDGKIVLLETIEGTHKPASYQPEAIFFN